MDITLGILSFIVAVLAVLQGLSMRQARHSRSNNSAITEKLGDISTQLGGISAQLGRMEQRLNDCWDKLKD